ncbi:cytochrome b/b6 domain-containing protein [Arthrobacter rhombi]|uniref:cytochrome b/b6 domain-containing protein n=1 Tax=Arthrobacter rhombi TaxID=71253 RepID=UPI0031D9A593
MTSELDPDRTPARRRMAGYTPLATGHPVGEPPAESASPQAEASLPDAAAAGPAATGPGQPQPPAADTTSAVPSDPQSHNPPASHGVSPASAAPEDGPVPGPGAVPQVPPSSAAPARKRRMAGAPAALPATGGASTQDKGQDSTANTPPAGRIEAATGSDATARPGTDTGAATTDAATAGAPTKRRMGGAPTSAATPQKAASTAPVSTPENQIPEAAVPENQPPAAPKRRMGTGSATQRIAPVSTTGVEEAPAPNQETASHTPEAATTAGPRKRMGGAPTTGTPTTDAGGNAPTPPASETSVPAAAEPAEALTSPAGAQHSAPTTRPAAQSAPAAAGPQAAAKNSKSSTGATSRERPAWVKPAAIIGGLVIVALLVVLGARGLRTLEGVQQFIATYDGHASQPDTTPVGMPWWMGWQHFLNMFFIVLIIRTGLQVRTERKPPGYWTAKKGSFFSPKSNTPKKVSLTQWLHQSLDVLWVANGIIFIVLLFATGHWLRIVPTSWDIFPNMVSGAIQYASLDWPTEHGWVHYNALQVMSYFLTVFIAAPLAILSGIRFSTWWPANAARLNKIYPVEWARAVHFPVMLYFVAFTIVHVFLVFFTGALRNLNHMFTSRDAADWWGLVIFLVSLVVIAAAWFLSKPLFTTPIAGRMGKVSK